MKVLQKISLAREKIKSTKLTKAGRNNHSKYDYFTPEQVNTLVYDACKDLQIHNKYQLLRTELGLTAQVEVFDLETGEKETYQMAMDIPQITATNISQQIGGAMTYSHRYLLMSIYDIVDNNLDFDSHETPKQKYNKNDDIKIWAQRSDVDAILKLIEAGDNVRAQKGLDYWTVPPRGMKKDWKTEINNKL